MQSLCRLPLTACCMAVPVCSGRLIRGRGEIVEEVVSQRRHQQINKQATLNDGAHFQKEMARRLVN